MGYWLHTYIHTHTTACMCVCIYISALVNTHVGTNLSTHVVILVVQQKIPNWELFFLLLFRFLMVLWNFVKSRLLPSKKVQIRFKQVPAIVTNMFGRSDRLNKQTKGNFRWLFKRLAKASVESYETLSGCESFMLLFILTCSYFRMFFFAVAVLSVVAVVVVVV